MGRKTIFLFLFLIGVLAGALLAGGAFLVGDGLVCDLPGEDQDRTAETNPLADTSAGVFPTPPLREGWIMTAQAVQEETGTQLKWIDAVWHLHEDRILLDDKPETGTVFEVFWGGRRIGHFSFSGDLDDPASSLQWTNLNLAFEPYETLLCYSRPHERDDSALIEWGREEGLRCRVVFANVVGDETLDAIGSLSYLEEDGRYVFLLYVLPSAGAHDEARVLLRRNETKYSTERIIGVVDLNDDGLDEIITSWEDGHTLEYRIYRAQGDAVVRLY